ncbi:MAG: pilin [Candidatus Saccharibacteria bacterium]
MYILGDTTATTCTHKFLTLEPWFYYLPSADFNPDSCTITSFNALGSKSDILLIALAILDDLIQIAALVAVGFVIYGGIQYVTSQGSPDATKKAQQTIINALIGLVLAILATAIVSFIGSKLGGLS